MRLLQRSGVRVAGTAAAVLAGLGSVTAVPASAATPGSWTSVQPGVAQSGCDGVRATVALDVNGALSLGASWNCRQALLPAPIGLVTSQADFTTGLDFVRRTDTPVSYDYEVKAGKSRVRARSATETRLVFAKGSAQMTVHVRTSADGMALRYELPSGATVLREATSFELPTDAQLSRQVFSPDHERGYATSTVADVPTGSYDMGMFAQQTNGARVLLAESGVDGNYSGGQFTHTQGTGRFTVALADAQIVRSGAFTTAWRTAAIGSTATVVESTLVDDVAPASKISDTSWIKPGVAAWPWLDGMWDTQRDLTKLKQWADYASSQGWPYLLVDDGWKDNQAIIPELVAYARDRGVRIMLWYHWQDLDTAAEREAQFTKITGWGVVGVKMDFMGSESQARQQWYDAALADTARYKLMVDLHGSRLSVGVHRTWPHVLTNEAVRGEEYPGGRDIGHVAALPFTRGLLGPADYSPMSFQQRNPNSDAAELALGVLLDSGIMLPGSRISDYQARPEAQRWMRMLPTAWDETKYVSGDPLTGGVIARRDGDRWFVGAFRRGGATTISYPTTFLGSGTWHAEITTDGSTGLTRTSKVIQAGDTLSVPAVAGGGHVVKLTKVPAIPTGNRTVTVAGSSHVLDVKGASLADDAEIIRWPGTGGTNQRFAFVPLGDGYTRIVNQASDKDVVVQWASRDAGAKAIQYPYEANANTNDEWLAEDAGNGRIRLLNRHSGLYLTAGAAQGDRLEQRPYDGADHQLFTVS
ncbi:MULTISPECIES: glycoside hydrolase family 97 catalytic domain-containing protein [Streptomyces]|uniref:Retaining alpha-galactosidase n=1 Tax=Streptomyces chartreusis NRRL 3882 TaxID=1079985 RepID=A0A2N9BLR3_STRCX|nr:MULTISPECIES: glycoside hydrolase family 97 catalytic domain-containing protein [Streptomyces]MYS88679.1 glycosyl hydrolase family 98 [Streptomyces sp. SID5464]SOR84302.1 Retaining alpha-galactosidase precursor [Streptomyces chartreusis NRRL 3882]